MSDVKQAASSKHEEFGTRSTRERADNTKTVSNGSKLLYCNELQYICQTRKTRNEELMVVRNSNAK